MTSQTSRPHRLVLFYEHGHGPSEVARHELTAARQEVEDDLGSVAVMNVAYCHAVCVAYDLSKFPTCIIFDEDQNVIERIDEADYLTRSWFYWELENIIRNRRFNALSL